MRPVSKALPVILFGATLKKFNAAIAERARAVLRCGGFESCEKFKSSMGRSHGAIGRWLKRERRGDASSA
jgi:hypothetical protein